MAYESLGNPSRSCFLRNALRAILLVLALILILPKTVQPGAVLRIGDPVPRVMMNDLMGKKITVPDSVKGNVAIIHFWAEGCSSCAKEMPALESLYTAFKKKGLLVIAVNVGQSPDKVTAFIRKMRVTYPVALDPENNTAKQYGALVLPMTFFLDRNGFIKYKILGEATEEILKKLVIKML